MGFFGVKIMGNIFGIIPIIAQERMVPILLKIRASKLQSLRARGRMSNVQCVDKETFSTSAGSQEVS